MRRYKFAKCAHDRKWALVRWRMGVKIIMLLWYQKGARQESDYTTLNPYLIADSEVHGANMGPIWGRQDPGGPHVGPMNFAFLGQLRDLIGSHLKIFRAERLRYALHSIFITNESAMTDNTLGWKWYYNCLWNAFLIFSPRLSVNTLRPRQIGAICQTTFSSAFYWMKSFELLINFTEVCS